MSDLISRNRILNLIEMWMKIPSYNESERNIMSALYYEVRTVSAEEPKKGRWIFSRSFVWECSECWKSPTKGMGYTQSEDELFRYCPNCGTKMEGVR